VTIGRGLELVLVLVLDLFQAAAKAHLTCLREMGAIQLKAVITVLGKDRPGIIAKIATALYEREVNIDDISQTIMQGLFTMVMIVDLGKLNTNIEELQAKMQEVENELGMQIRVKREEVFTAMHQI
jgi:ACT domain-containing protein